MKISKYKEIKQKIENSNFETNYSIIDRILFYFSFLGNIASIIFAYFFVNVLLYNAIDEFWGKNIIIPLISFIALTSFELLKRFLFKQTTLNLLMNKNIINETVVTIFFSLILISSSFYLSLNGAEKMADKSKKIDNNIEIKINSKTDSITKIYDKRISKLETDKQNYLTIIGDGNKSVRLITQYNNLINKSNNEISSLEKEKSNKIDTLEIKVNQKATGLKKEVNSNIYSFLFISSFIELIILIGVWFDAYYIFRSFNEFDDKVNQDSNYKKFLTYEILLSTLFNNGKVRRGDEFDSFNKFKEIIKIKGLNINDKTIKDFYTIIKYLKISNTVGNKRIAEKNYEDSKEIIIEYYNI